MMGVSRYRRYLAKKALPLDGLGLVNEMRTQLLPWIALPFLPVSIFWLFSVPNRVEHWIVRPFLCISVLGVSLVFWEFFLSPLRNDIVSAWERRDRH